MTAPEGAHGFGPLNARIPAQAPQDGFKGGQGPADRDAVGLRPQSRQRERHGLFHRRPEAFNLPQRASTRGRDQIRKRHRIDRRRQTCELGERDGPGFEEPAQIGRKVGNRLLVDDPTLPVQRVERGDLVSGRRRRKPSNEGRQRVR